MLPVELTVRSWLAQKRREYHRWRRHAVILTVLNDTTPGTFTRGFYCLSCHKGWRA